MKIYQNTPSLQALNRPVIKTQDLEASVKEIIEKVKQEGDEALLKLTKTYDKVELQNIKVSQEEIEQAIQKVDTKLKAAIEIAKNNIKRFHQSQKEVPQVIETSPGTQCWRKNVGIEKIGLYIPGGTAPLFSTVLMLGVPAQIAGCAEVILCTPPQPDGSIHPAILYTAQSIGITNIYKVGGAQAIAAMAFGTEAISKVNKIFGPGNQYVTAAKQEVSRAGVAIDLPAGPSELMVVADQTAVPAFVAADLLSQAEHGIDSQVVLIAFDNDFVAEVLKEIDKQLMQLPRKEIAQTALKNSVAIIVKDKKEALDIINDYAPEHLIVALENAEYFAMNIRNAGSVFLGNYTPESAGDYASGTNHTLPTNGFAKAYSGVSLDSFVKKITFQKITDKGLQNIGPTVEVMAAAENLEAHKNAVTLRLSAILQNQEKEGKSDSIEVTPRDNFSLKTLIRSDLRGFQPYASARDEFKGEAEVFLDANENPYNTNLNRYPDPMQKELKSAIGALKGLRPENVFLGNGSDEAIDLLIRLFCEMANDSILTLPPTYGVYSVCAKTAGVKVKTLPLDKDFQIDQNGLGGFGLRRSKILFICNPNNPTGSIIPRAVLEKIIADFPGIVVVDEAYIDFAEMQTCCNLIDEYPNLVVLQTFSKAWGLAGARLGMAFSNPELIDWLNKIKLPYNINQLTQQEVLRKIKNRDKVTTEIQSIQSERKRISEALATFKFVEKVFPSQTNFILTKVKIVKQLYEFLLTKGIIVRDRSTQLNCENCLRITVGTPEENDRLISALKIFQDTFTNLQGSSEFIQQSPSTEQLETKS